MSKLPYRISEAGSRLYRAGVSYHDYGTTYCDGERLFDYFQCDRVTDEQKAELIVYCPDVQFVSVSHRHAPELCKVQVLFPKAAWYRRYSI